MIDIRQPVNTKTDRLLPFPPIPYPFMGTLISERSVKINHFEEEIREAPPAPPAPRRGNRRPNARRPHSALLEELQSPPLAGEQIRHLRMPSTPRDVDGRVAVLVLVIN